MRSPLAATVLLLLASSVGLQGAEAKLGSCETAIGAWEFTAGAGGRAVVTREGANYHTLWITKVVNPSTGTTEAAGGAADCTCSKGPAMLVWNCHVAFSLRPDQIGANERYEWVVDGPNLRAFLVGGDGKRNEGITFRRPK